MQLQRISSYPSSSSSSPRINYTHHIETECVLDKPLTEEYEMKVLRSPAAWELLYHGLLKFFNENNQKYPADHLLQDGEKYLSTQPEHEGDDTSISQVTLIKDDNSNETVNDLITPGKKSRFEKMRFCFKYIKTPIPKMEIKFSCIPKDPSSLKVIEIVFNHLLLRVQRVANKPIETFAELKTISDLKFEKIEGTSNLDDFPYGISTVLTVHKPIDQVRSELKDAALFKNILPGVFQASKERGKLEVGDDFTVKAKNISVTTTPFEEEINFTVKQISDDHLVLTSNEKVTHFHQLGYEISLKKGEENDNDTDIQLSICHKSSKLVGIATSAMKIASHIPLSYVTDRTVDIPLLMFLRSRNMLESSARLINNYFNGKAQETSV